MPRAAALLLAALVTAALAPAPGRAQPLDLAVSPILIIDQERLFAESQLGARIAAGIEDEAEALAAENRRIEAELIAEELALTEQRAELPVDEFRALADAFDEKVQRIRAEQDAKELDLQRRREEERQEFLNRIGPILGELARERGAVAVLDRRAVFLAADRIDITDEAIDRLNAEIAEDMPAPPGDASPDAAPGIPPEPPGESAD